MVEVTLSKVTPDTLVVDQDSVQMLTRIIYRSGQTVGYERIATIPFLHGLKHGISLGPGSQNMAESFDKDNIPKVIQRIEDFLHTVEMAPLSEAFLLLPSRPGEPELVDITQKDVENAKKRPVVRNDIETGVHASAIFTDTEGTPLLCKPADCPVVILVGVGANGQSVLGLIHSGRAETNALIPLQSVEHMRNFYGCKPEDVAVGIAPSIGKNHYFIKQKDATIINRAVWENFTVRRFISGEERLYLDILGNIILQLKACGVDASQIQAYGNEVDTFELAGKNPPEAYSQRYSNATGDASKSGRILVAAQL